MLKQVSGINNDSYLYIYQSSLGSLTLWSMAAKVCNELWCCCHEKSLLPNQLLAPYMIHGHILHCDLLLYMENTIASWWKVFLFASFMEQDQFSPPLLSKLVWPSRHSTRLFGPGNEALTFTKSSHRFRTSPHSVTLKTKDSAFVTSTNVAFIIALHNDSGHYPILHHFCHPLFLN